MTRQSVFLSQRHTIGMTPWYDLEERSFSKCLNYFWLRLAVGSGLDVDDSVGWPRIEVIEARWRCYDLIFHLKKLLIVVVVNILLALLWTTKLKTCADVLTSALSRILKFKNNFRQTCSKEEGAAISAFNHNNKYINLLAFFAQLLSSCNE